MPAPGEILILPSAAFDYLREMQTAAVATEEVGRRAEAEPRDYARMLAESETFLRYRDAFEDLTGLPLVLRGKGSTQPPLFGSPKAPPFCRWLTSGPAACAACQLTQARAEAEAVADARTVQCFAGLSETLVPVRIGERVIAYLQTGQIFLRPPTARAFERTRWQLQQAGLNPPRARLRSSYFAAPVIPPERYESVLRLLTSFAALLSVVASRASFLGDAPQHPQVAKAVAYLEEHYSEPVSLTRLASAVHLSRYHLCKLLRKSLGMTLTEYLARVRVDRAREMLHDPNLRISEAAFAAGFQSLSQFNRTFRRYSGETATVYRERLHGAARVMREILT